MGNDCRTKGLLLDEADFTLPRDCDLETLVTAVCDFCEAEFANEFDHPALEINGVCAEGFGPEPAGPYTVKPLWVKPEVEFRDIFLAIAAGLNIPEDMAGEAIRTGCVDGLESHLSDRIQAHLQAQEYHAAQELMTFVSDLKRIGLPGVLSPSHFDTRGEDMIVDYRNSNYGPGRRILAEIVFDWGQ